MLKIVYNFLLSIAAMNFYFKYKVLKKIGIQKKINI